MQGLVKKLKEKYQKDLDDLDYSQKNTWNPDSFLFAKWDSKIGKGWYGFSLQDCPLIWGNIIDEFLNELEIICPKFEIHQIKLKFGGLRFYVSLYLDDQETLNIINEEIRELEEWLRHKSLIY